MVTMEELISAIKSYGEYNRSASWYESIGDNSRQMVSDAFATQELVKLQGHLQVIWDLAEERAVVLRKYRDLLLRVQGPDAMDRWKAAGSLQYDHAKRTPGEYDAVLTPEGIQEIEGLNRRLSYQEDTETVTEESVSHTLEVSTGAISLGATVAAEKVLSKPGKAKAW